MHREYEEDTIPRQFGYRRRVSSDECVTKVETVRYSPYNLVGQDSTKSVNSTVSSLLQFTGSLKMF